jgi:hypothetical protein
MEQETIFDEQFDEEVFVRRRDIMPVWLKIYAWVWMIMGGVTFIQGIPKTYATIKAWLGAAAIEPNVFSTLFTSVISGTILFFMGFSLWMEYKWAIWFNWTIAILLTGFTMFMAIRYGFYDALTAPSFWICIPFWIMLFKIHKDWHQRAVKGKD